VRFHTKCYRISLETIIVIVDLLVSVKCGPISLSEIHIFYYQLPKGPTSSQAVQEIVGELAFECAVSFHHQCESTITEVIVYSFT